ARVDPTGITVWASTQHPFPVRKEVAEMFGLPLARVQVIVPYLGGAYGNKSYTKIEPLTIALASHVRRPVRLALTVEEGFKTVRRAAVRYRLKTGVTRDGTLVARDCEIHYQLGAYADGGLRKAAAAIGWTEPVPPRRGKGIACTIKAPLAPSVSSAMVRLHADGSATLLTATVEIGQGARTTLSQIVAQELALPLDRVRIARPEIGMSPYDQATSASRSTTLMGLAVMRAARGVRG